MADGSNIDSGPPTEAVPVHEGGASSTGWVLSGRYRVIERLGASAKAEIFRARDELLHRDVALKVFRSPVGRASSTSSVQRGELELQALAGLRHPNLIALYDGSLTAGQPAYLVLELVDGPNLADRLLRGPLASAQVRQIGAQIADALGYVHAHGMVHRDVTAANILLGSNEEGTGFRARLSDFGIVGKVERRATTGPSSASGNSLPSAPPHGRDDSHDGAPDLYALGVVLLECLTGVHVDSVGGRHAGSGHPDPPLAIPTTLPPPWPGLLAAMTDPDPAARPTAASVASILNSEAVPASVAMTTAPVVVPPVATPPVATAAVATPPDSTAAPQQRNVLPYVLLGTLLMLGVITVGGVLLLQTDSTSRPPSLTPRPTVSSPIGAHTTARDAPLVQTVSHTSGTSPSAVGPSAGRADSGRPSSSRTRPLRGSTPSASPSSDAGHATRSSGVVSSRAASSTATASSSAPATEVSSTATSSSSAPASGASVNRLAG